MRLREQKRAIVHTYSTHFVSTVRDCLVLLACRRAQGEDVRVAHREADGPWHDALAGEDARLPLGGRVRRRRPPDLGEQRHVQRTHSLALAQGHRDLQLCAPVLARGSCVRTVRTMLRVYSQPVRAVLFSSAPYWHALRTCSTYATVQYMSV